MWMLFIQGVKKVFVHLIITYLLHTAERLVQGFGGGKLQGKRMGRPRRRWEDNIKMDFGEVGYGLD
jgi:hypothetical protein